MVYVINLVLIKSELTLEDDNMESPIGNIIPCSFLDWPSHLGYVVFFKGCNWACGFCQNYLLLQKEWDSSFGIKFILNGIKGMRSFIDALVLSVLGDTRVLVKVNGIIRNLRIEELWKEEIGSFIRSGYEFQLCDDVEAMTKGGKFQRVNRIIRHRAREVLVISLSSGYEVAATSGHSVFTLSESGMQVKAAGELSPGDYLLTPKHLPVKGNLKAIYLKDFFQAELDKAFAEMQRKKVYWEQIVLEVLTDRISIQEAQVKYGHARSTLHVYIQAYQEGKLENVCYCSRPGLLWISEGYLCFGKQKLLPASILVSAELCELLGYAVADGSMRAVGYVITLGNDWELAKRILFLYRKIFFSNTGSILRVINRCGNPQYSVIFGGKSVGRLIGKLVGNLCFNKRIPDLIFNTSKRNQRTFLRGLHTCDGHYRQRSKHSCEEFSIKTTSAQLVSDLVILLKSFRIHPFVAVEEANQVRRKLRSYKVYFHGNQFERLGLRRGVQTQYSFLTSFEGVPKELVGMGNLAGKWARQKRVSLEGVPEKYRECGAYIAAQSWNPLEVKKIEKKEVKNSYVYDLEVPGDNSFLGGLGAVLLHNSGGEPLLHIDFLESFCKEIKSLGLLIKLDTNGSEPYALERLLCLGLIDFVSMDIKAPLKEEDYSKVTGVFQDRARLSLIKNSMGLLDRYKIPHVYRTTVVKVFHSREDILSIACNIEGAEEYHLQDFDDRDPLDSSLTGTGGYGRRELESWIPEIKRYVKKVLVFARE